MRNIQVVPVLDKPVEIFEEPPENGTGWKEKCKTSRTIGKKRVTGTFEAQAVDKDNVTSPQGKKGMVLHGLEPLKPIPCDNPANKYAPQTGPAPPWKTAMWRARCKAGFFLSGVYGQCQQKGGA